MGGFTIPRGYRLSADFNAPGVSVVDSYGGQRVSYDAGADLAPISLAVSQAVNANNPALAQRNYRDFVDRSALDYAEIDRRKADSNLNTAIGLLSAVAMPYAAPALGSLFGGGLLGSAVGGGLIGGATAAATGDSIVEGVLTGGLSGGLAGVDVGQVLPAASRATQAVTDSGISALSAVSAAGPAVMTKKDESGWGQGPTSEEAGFPTWHQPVPVIVERPREEAGGGGSTAAPAPTPAPTPAPAPVPAPSPAPVESKADYEHPWRYEGNGLFVNVFTGAMKYDEDLPDYFYEDVYDREGEVVILSPPIGERYGQADPRFETSGTGTVEEAPDEQQEDVVDVFLPPDLVVDTTAPDTFEPEPVPEPVTPPPAPAPEPVTPPPAPAPEPVTPPPAPAPEPVVEPAPEPVVEPAPEPVAPTPTPPTPEPTPAPEPAPTPVQEPVEQPAPEPSTGADESVAVGGEGTGTGEGSGAGEGEGEGDGSGDGVGLGAGMMAAAASAAFEPQWSELFKYTTLTPYQKKTLAPYVDYIAQARGMTGRGMLS